MKRTFAIAAAACTLAVPAIAFGQTFAGNFNGHLEGAKDSPVTLKFAGATNPDGSTEAQVNVFAVHNLTVTCEDGLVLTLNHAKLKGRRGVPVNDAGTFHVRDNNGRTRFALDGHIGANKAFGNFRLGGKIEGADGGTQICDSGKLAWVARP